MFGNTPTASRGGASGACGSLPTLAYVVRFLANPFVAAPTQNHLKNLASLRSRKGRRAHGSFLVEGLRSVEAAVNAKAPLIEILMEHEKAADVRLRAHLEAADVPILAIARRDLARLSDVEHGQGVIAVARSVVMDAPRALDGAQAVLALDGVQDPGNVGTLVRTAAWFGVDVVLAGPGTADFESPKVVRSSMGGLWDVRLVQTDDLGSILKDLAQNGMTITGADVAGPPAASWKRDRAGVLVLGSEAHGISDAVRALLDRRVSVNSNRSAVGRGVESLNVVVAGGILMERWLGAGRQTVL